MSLVTASIQIAAPPEEVWQMVMDPAASGEWVTIHRRLVRTPTRARRGSGFEMDQQIHLRGVQPRGSLDARRLQRRASWPYGRDAGPPARARAPNTSCAAEDGGTRFDYRNEFRPPLGPVGALVSRALVGGMPEREAKRTLERLRSHLEQEHGSGN